MSAPLLPRLCTATVGVFIGGNATATSLYGGMDNDLVSITGDLSAGEIIGGSGADSVISPLPYGFCHSEVGWHRFD